MEEKQTKKPRVLSEATRQKNRERQAARRAANPDENRENMRRWLAKPENVERKNKVQKAYYEANKETYAANRKRWSEANKDHEKEWHKNHYAENPDRYRDWRLQREYGVTVEWYKEKLAVQGGGCAICGSEDSKVKGRNFHIDHNHKTDKNRGLLCHHCNVALGSFGDSVKRLKAAITYLLAHGTPDDS